MTSIDQDVRSVLEQMNASMPAPADFDVATFRAMVEGHQTPRSSITLAAIEDTIVPGPVDPLPARLYRPTLDRNQPAMLFIHGGGFIQRGVDSHDEMCRRLAIGTTSTIVAVDCRPAPEHPHPAAVDDAYATIQAHRQGRRHAGARPLQNRPRRHQLRSSHRRRYRIAVSRCRLTERCVAGPGHPDASPSGRDPIAAGVRARRLRHDHGTARLVLRPIRPRDRR